MPAENTTSSLPPGGLPEEAEGFVLAHWNKHFLCYCLERGNGDPLEQYRQDLVQWPGAPMTGFLVWYPAQWQFYMDALEPNWRTWKPSYRKRFRQHHEQRFTEWLWAKYASGHVAFHGLFRAERNDKPR